MIGFSQFEVRVDPNKPAMQLFASDWALAQKSKQYQDFIKKAHPRSIQVTEQRYWQHDSEPYRAATDEEIASFITDNRHLRTAEALAPFAFYQYFGDKAVFKPLIEKMQAEYKGYMESWKAAFQCDPAAFAARLEEVCTATLTMDGILNCGDYYEPQAMERLLHCDRPLTSLMEQYTRTLGFPIRSEVEDILGMFSHNKRSGNVFWARDPAIDGLEDHQSRMRLLDRKLDAEIALLEEKWRDLDFQGTMEQALEIYSVRQLYAALKNDKHLYSADELDVFAEIADPIANVTPQFLGERSLRPQTPELAPVLLGMFPDIMETPDPWRRSANEPSEPECGPLTQQL